MARYRLGCFAASLLLLLLLATISTPPVDSFLNRGYQTKTNIARQKPRFASPTTVSSQDQHDISMIDDETASLVVSKGFLDLDFNPAYVSVEHFDKYGPVLVVSTFFNVAHNPNILEEQPNERQQVPLFLPFHRDMVALVDLMHNNIQESTVIPITDVLGGPPKTVWPNYSVKAPPGLFNFEAVIIPQGWFATMQPGRLTAVNVETLQEYIIHQSTVDAPRFYHQVAFVDMDQDGLLDIVSVRSAFKVMPVFLPPTGELVWFRNPGIHQPNATWEEHVLIQKMAGGPDVAICVSDIEGNGVPVIAATQFFAGLESFQDSPWAWPSRLTLFGAPVGGTWADAEEEGNDIRETDILVDQGEIFGCEFVDLDNDGRVELLVTNHQSLASKMPGRVFALEQPTKGDIFDDPWVTHILMDKIQPNPQPETGEGRSSEPRMAPGSAKSFRPNDGRNGERPWIAVSGDEAGKAWVLEPSTGWHFIPHLIFDMNDYYGPNTTQTILKDPFGIIISTVGEIGIEENPNGTILYVPAYEATDIHVFQLNRNIKEDKKESNDQDSSAPTLTALTTVGLLFFLLDILA